MIPMESPEGGTYFPSHLPGWSYGYWVLCDMCETHPAESLSLSRRLHSEPQTPLSPLRRQSPFGWSGPHKYVSLLLVCQVRAESTRPGKRFSIHGMGYKVTPVSADRRSCTRYFFHRDLQ